MAMKKTLIVGAALLAAGTAMAQTALVKEVEREMKGNPDAYPAAIEKLKPAFTNEETAKDAKTYKVAADGAVNYFSAGDVLISAGKEDVNKKAVGRALLDAYKYADMILANDTVVDAKGKVKTKYSKDALKLKAANFTNLINAGNYMSGAQDPEGAAEAWTYVVENRENPLYAEIAKTLAPDLWGELYFFIGISDSQIGKHKESYENFRKAYANGYDKKEAYDYAISEAYQIDDKEGMAEVAAEAYPKYGAEDSSYIGRIINNYIDKKQFAEASKLLDDFIAKEPTNSQLYYVKGILADAQGDKDNVMPNYLKAVELDPDNAAALFQIGYQLALQAEAIDQAEGGGLSNEQYAALRNEKINPLYRQAAEKLEKAYQLNNELDDARRLLRTIYYQLNDEENLQRVSNM